MTKDFTTFVTDWVSSTGTWTIPTQTASGSGDVYEVRFRDLFLTDALNESIDLAIQAAGHASALQDAVSQARAFRSGQSLYPAPTNWKYINAVWIDTAQTYVVRHTPNTFDTRQAFKDAAARTYLAQSFQISATNPSMILGDVYLLLGKVGSPTGNLTVTIETNTGTAPTGVAGSVVSSATVDATTLTADHAYVQFAFTAKPVLTTNTTYWIVLKSSAAADASNYLTWGLDVDAGYSSGAALNADATPTWSSVTGDFVFIVRESQPRWDLRLVPGRDFGVIADSTRQIYLTDHGRAVAGRAGDGMAMLLHGQSYPTLPTSDSSTVEVPFDYVLARAALQLVAENPTKYKGDSRSAIAMWSQQVGSIERQMLTQPKGGSLSLEAL